MKYYTRSSDCDLIFLKEVKPCIEKKDESKSLDCDNFLCNEVKSTKRRGKSKNLVFKSKKNCVIQNKISLQKSKNKCSHLKNKLNGLKQIRPCSVILEKINVKQFGDYLQVPKSYPIATYELNQTIKPCSVNLKKIDIKQLLNCTNIFKQFSKVSQKQDFKENNKYETKFSEAFQEIKRGKSSFINSLSESSFQHVTQNAVFIKTEVIKEEDAKQFENSHNTDERKFLLNEYPTVNYELNQTIKPCSINLQKMWVKTVVNNVKMCENKSLEVNQDIKRCNETSSSFVNSLSQSSIHHGKESTITIKTERNLCLEQDKNKQINDLYITDKSEILLNHYFCAHCSKVLPSKKALYYHICNSKRKNGFLCEICFKNFDFYHLLIKHKSCHALSLSCSKIIKKKRKSSIIPLIRTLSSDQSLKDSNKFNCVSFEKCKLKENNPPKKQTHKRKISLKNPVCASTSSGNCSSKLEFLPYLWESDESGTEQ